MQTIIITLNSDKMDNPDLDIRYVLPDRIDEYTDGAVTDNGYDYLDDDIMGIWLETDDAAGNVARKGLRGKKSIGKYRIPWNKEKENINKSPEVVLDET